MIELSQGRSVKWQHNGAWFTGYVLNDNDGNSFILLNDDNCLVRHSSTSAVFIVDASELIDNDFRKAEKLAESEATKCES